MIKKFISSLQYPETPFQQALKRFLRPFVRPFRNPYKSRLKSITKALSGSFYRNHWNVLTDNSEPHIQFVKSVTTILDRRFTPPEEKGPQNLNLIKQISARELLESFDSNAKAETLIDKARHLVLLDVKDIDAFQAYIAVIKRLNHEAIDLFRKHSSPHLIMHLSCTSRMSRACESMTSFAEAEHAGISQIILTGDPERQTFSFDPFTKHLVVPASDVYEHLPSKIMAAMFFIALCGVTDSVLKVDDDHRLADLGKLQAGFRKADLVDTPVQLGFIKDAQWLGNSDRVWHFGKCQDAARGNTAYSFPGTTTWATGSHGYFLNKAALRLLLWSYVYFPAYIEAGLYEDIIVSDLLLRQGGELCSLKMEGLLDMVAEY